MKTEPLEIYAEYQKIVQYCTNNNLYEIVKTNENFYDGRQWEGIRADNMPKPVINVLQRVVKYLIATINSNDVAISMIPMTSVMEDIEKTNVIVKAIMDLIEQAKIKESAKLMVRNGAVDGSSYMMQTFDPEYETYQEAKGRIVNQLVDNTCMYFGNPYSNDIQGQPWIIVALRQHISQVRQEAEDMGVNANDVEAITPDSDTDQANDDSDDLVTVLIKFYKKKKKVREVKQTVDLYGMPVEIVEEHEEKTVWFTKCTRNVVIVKPTDLGYRRYPISQFGWDPKKNSYLFNSPLTYVIPNQIFINKCYAIAMMYGLQSAFPKIVYDQSKVELDEIMETNFVGTASIDMMGKFLDFIKIPDFSNNILALVQDIMQQTKECMGVNDASLGNVKPENTSAIIALQESANVPLEIQRQSYFEMWEDTVRNILDIMTCTYGVRTVMTEENQLATVDFSLLRGLNFNLRVEIGNGSQFSETAQMTTLNNLYNSQVIDGETLVENTPQKLLTSKQRILQKIKEQREMMAQQQQMMAQQMPPQGPPQMQ